MRSPIILASALAALASGAVAQQFDYIPGGIPGGSVWSNGVEIADIDGDNDLDVLFANGSSYGSGGSQPQHLFLNDGSGVLTAAHGQLNVSNFNAQMVIAEDFDNDGDLDLMYAPEGSYPATNQFPHFLINDGTGNFTDESQLRLPAVSMASFCVCAGDVDNDGDLDVVFTDGGTFSGVASQARLYLNDGNGFFTNATSTHLPSDTYNAQDVTLIDYDGDFDIDIALSGKGQNNKRSRLWLNDGTGNFTISNAMNNVGSGGTYEVEFADLDGDDDVDGLVQSISSFNEGWARNNGPTTAMTKTTFPSPNGQDDNEMAAMDYDLDGDFDVFVGSLGSSEKVYRNTGAVFQQDTGAIESQGDSTLDLGFGDLDGDGDYEMVTAQGESGNFTNKVYRNTGPADGLAPVYVRTEVPGALTTPETSFRVQIRDQVADDGHISATMTYTYTTQDSGAGTTGSGQAMHQGGGQFRAAVPTAGDTTQISLTWIATDSVGNTSISAPVDAPAVCLPPFTYGVADVSTLGNTAKISTSGGDPSVSNPNFTIELTGGNPNQGGLLVESSNGQGSTPTPWGTILVGAPFLRHPAFTSATGTASYPVPMSPAMAGQTLNWFWVIRDPGPTGAIAHHSDGLEITFCP